MRSAAPLGLGSTFPLTPRVRRLTRGWILPSLWDWPQSIQNTCDLAKPRAPAGAPEYKPGVSPRTPGKACIAGLALKVLCFESSDFFVFEIHVFP